MQRESSHPGRDAAAPIVPKVQPAGGRRPVEDAPERLAGGLPADLGALLGVGALENPDATYSIRELCDAFDVTPRALRFYEDQGLISPKRQGQQRIYSARDRARIKLILRGKRFGFSLAEVRELLDLYDLGDGQVTQLQASLEKGREKLGVLRERQEDIKAAIDELVSQLQLVESMLAERMAAKGAGED